jgi:hypothetical protein
MLAGDEDPIELGGRNQGIPTTVTGVVEKPSPSPSWP